MLKTVRTLQDTARRAEARAATARDRGETNQWFRAVNNAARIRALAEKLARS